MARKADLLTRAQVSKLLTKMGYPLSIATLTTYAAKARNCQGPPYVKVRKGSSFVTLYDQEDVVAWCNMKVRKLGKWEQGDAKDPDPNRIVGDKKSFGRQFAHNGHRRHVVQREIREMVMQALHGDKLNGVEYFEWLAKNNSSAFTTLLVKIMPTQINATVKGDVRDLSTAEILAALAAQGVAVEEEGGGEHRSVH